jgi:gluconokinase
MHCLAIELSTASAKAMLYASDRGIVTTKSVPFGTDICDMASQDSEGVFAALTRAVRAVREQAPADVDAIGLCTTWHSILFLDERRKPVDRIYTWANSRASRTVAGYRRDQAACEAYYQRTGCMVNATYPLWQYIHFRDTRPDLIGKTAYLSSQGEFLFERLTGEIAASLCTASGSGFLNIRDLAWDEESIEFCRARPEQFAPLKEATYAAPLRAEIAALWNVGAGIPVVIGGADGALNQIGDGALGEGVMTFSLGTSGALRLATDQVVLPPKPATWCYYLAGGRWVVGGSTAGAGNCLTWFADKMSLDGRLDFRSLDTAAETVDGEKAPIFLPFPYGERCPGWRDDRRAEFRYLSGEHGLADLYYSVLEGVLFNLYHCYTILTDLMPEPDRILVSGGIVRSAHWIQMAADIFGKELSVSNVEHVSLLGAVGVVHKALDPSYDLGRRSNGDGARIGPDEKSAARFERRFERYKDCYLGG